MSETLDGIEEKLKRAEENVRNLNSEISAFFQGCRYPVLPDIDDEKLLEAIDYHRSLVIPIRFKVLAGEIVHHLRSCLDHIVWSLSEDTYRESDGKFIEFPILETRPVRQKNVFTRYTRKVKGITSLDARKIIVRLQPYRGTDPANDALSIIHAMDIMDKHRELLIVSNIGTVRLPEPIARQFRLHLSGQVKRMSDQFKREFKAYGPVTPQIVFGKIGQRKLEPVIPRLTQLINYTRFVVSLFADKFN